MLALVIVLGTAAISFAQPSASQTATINAYIEKGLTMAVSNATLNLGNLVAGTTPAAVNPHSGTVPHFTVTGDGGHTVNITFDASVMLHTTGDSIAFTTDFEGDNTASQSGAAAISATIQLSGTSPAAGTYDAWLGGNVGAISASQTPGSYTGTFHVSVNY